MRDTNFFRTMSLVAIVGCWAGIGAQQGPMKQAVADGAGVVADPSFSVSLKPVLLNRSIPFLQSCAWARSGDKILLIGGRTEGFHGTAQSDSLFSKSRANSSVWVLNLTDFTARSVPVDTKETSMMQYLSSNMEFVQDGDMLFIAGGFGARKPGDTHSNHTFARIAAIQVSAMIRAVETGSPISKAILYTASSPFVQVTGGELVKAGDTFYLMFGQKYDTTYQEQITGQYTSAIRKFRFKPGAVTDTSSIISPVLHRRDLTVAPIIQKNNLMYGAFGGVFTAEGDGYQNPVFITIGQTKPAVKPDTLKQITNQYDCAFATIYDPISDTNITVLMGGIGKFQYCSKTDCWEDGDGGQPLPFVKSITQMHFRKGRLSQHIQLPPLEAEMPGLIGAGAIFFPHRNLCSANRVIDYTKLKGNSVSIGYLYGGIKSMFASTNLTPTTINKTVYEVFLHKTTNSRKDRVFRQCDTACESSR